MLYFKAMPNSIDFYKGIFLHVIAVRIIVSWCDIMKSYLQIKRARSFVFGVEKSKNSRPEVFCRKGLLRNFAKFTGKHLCQSLFIKKETLVQVLSCEFGEISKNTFFYRTPLVTVSGKDVLTLEFLLYYS